MRLVSGAMIFLIVFLAGCATMRKGQDAQAQQLKNRITYLEAELQRKNQEISSLENELERAQDVRLTSRKQKIEDVSSAPLTAKQIQMTLKNAGFYKGPIDGKIGPKTKEAIKDFQKARGLKVDGIVGKRTTQELRKYLSR